MAWGSEFLVGTMDFLVGTRKLLEMEPDKPNMAKGYVVVATGTAAVAKAFAIRE
jgi:hypothetical protein